MSKYYALLGLHLDKVKMYFDENKIKYNVKIIEGKKDKDNLVVPRVIRIFEKSDNV